MGGYCMENQLKELFGSWIQAIGTVITAIGSTPLEGLSSYFRESLDLWGNALQATGNALIADAQDTFSFEKLGNEVQATGNTTVIAGMIIDFKDETKQKLIINGNWLQALGGSISLPEELEQEESAVRTLTIIGNILQVIGNSLQAIGGIEELKGKNENKKNDSSDDLSLEVIGSWIQAVGSVISAIAQTIENTGSKDKNRKNEPHVQIIHKHCQK